MKYPDSRSAAAVSLFAATLLLAACGGGGGSGSDLASASNSTPPVTTGVVAASGIVTGFGSVFVDGVEIDDSRAYTRMENADGGFDMVPLQLGQRVRVARDGGGAASTINVDAAALGAVSAGSINATALTFSIASQVVKANTDGAAGPLTYYGGGYTGFADIAAGDLVEVHGSAVYDSASAAYVVQASRIEKKAAISAVRVTGSVAKLDTAAKTFAINGLTVAYASANVVPATGSLAAGRTVVVWGAPAALVASGSTLTLTASRVRIMNASLPDSVTSGSTQFGGLVSNYSVSAGTFTIEGVKVSVGSARISPTGASIANGAYVQVSGSVGTDGSITASEIGVRVANTASSAAVIRLIGALQSVTDPASFVLRGVPVDASAVNVATACPGITLAVGTVVNVTATAQVGTDVVLASNLSCPGTQAGVMRAMNGSAGTVDAAAKTFVLTAAGGTTQKVQWNDATVFAGVSASTLSGATVVVEGYLDAAGGLVARMVRNPSVMAGRMDADAYNGLASSANRSWTQYRAMRR